MTSLPLTPRTLARAVLAGRLASAAVQAPRVLARAVTMQIMGDGVGPESEPEPEPWTPADLATAPSVWLDAAATDSLTLAGSDVTAWADLGSTATTFTQGGINGGTAPAYAVAGLNGRPTLDFDGTSERVSSGASVATIMGTSDFAVFAVGCIDSSATNDAFGYLNEGLWGDREGWVGLYARSSPPVVGAYVFDTGNRVAQAAYAFGTAALFHHEISGGFVRLRVDGGAEVSAATTGIGGGTSQPITIGRMSVGDQHSLDGAVSEFLIIKPAPDADTRQMLEGYLAHKWGLAASLPPDHPWKAAAP